MNASIQNQLIADVAYDLVGQLDPEELPLFSAFSEEFFFTPEATSSGRTGEDEMLGFGTGEIIAWTSVLLPLITEIVRYLTEQVKKSGNRKSAEEINNSVKEYFNTTQTRQGEKTESLALTDEQLTWIRNSIRRKARQLKLSEARANILADAVIGSLATTSKKQ